MTNDQTSNDWADYMDLVGSVNTPAPAPAPISTPWEGAFPDYGAISGATNGPTGYSSFSAPLAPSWNSGGVDTSFGTFSDQWTAANGPLSMPTNPIFAQTFTDEEIAAASQPPQLPSMVRSSYEYRRDQIGRNGDSIFWSALTELSAAVNRTFAGEERHATLESPGQQQANDWALRAENTALLSLAAYTMGTGPKPGVAARASSAASLESESFVAVGNILNPEFTPNATLPELIIRGAEARGVATPENGFIPWSGLGKNGAATAEAWAARNGGTTLEMTPGGRWLSDMDLFGPRSPVTRVEARMIWEEASASAARQASGQVRPVLGPVSPNSIYWSVEVPELLNNPAVTGFDPYYLYPKIGIH